MVKLADTIDLGSIANGVQVQVLLPAPNSTNPNLVLVGDGFGFTVSITYPNFNHKK